MPRKPNYSFERSQRANAKAAKKAARLLAKAEKSAGRKAEVSGSGVQDQPEEATPDGSKYPS